MHTKTEEISPQKPSSIYIRNGNSVCVCISFGMCIQLTFAKLSLLKRNFASTPRNDLALLGSSKEQKLCLITNNQQKHSKTTNTKFSVVDGNNEMRVTKSTQIKSIRLQGSKQSKLAGSQLPTASRHDAMRLRPLISCFRSTFNFNIKFIYTISDNPNGTRQRTRINSKSFNPLSTLSHFILN